eukprot:TRINITY_DN10667_c0_g1_i2.p1 TRINITY_DN10667_c0_g1~~TRINITY_DN10667_c0_g1_i2.p1  ORF type:complete len:771 (+),score=131.47 TRINITY_DN10667_c0_g1_i2:131-2443(+)
MRRHVHAPTMCLAMLGRLALLYTLLSFVHFGEGMSTHSSVRLTRDALSLNKCRGTFPCQVHITYGEKPGQMRVQWITFEPTSAASVVYYRLLDDGTPMPPVRRHQLLEESEEAGKALNMDKKRVKTIEVELAIGQKERVGGGVAVKSADKRGMLSVEEDAAAMSAQALQARTTATTGDDGTGGAGGTKKGSDKGSSSDQATKKRRKRPHATVQRMVSRGVSFALNTTVYVKEKQVPVDDDESANNSASSMPVTERAVIKTRYVHEAMLVGLLPGRIYEYRVGEAQKLMTSLFHFRSQPTLTSPTSIAVYADTGVTGQPVIDVEHMLEERRDTLSALFHVGDTSYSSSRVSHWDTWGEINERMAAYVPFFLAPGNWDTFPMQLENWYRRFHMPLAQPPRGLQYMPPSLPLSEDSKLTQISLVMPKDAPSLHAFYSVNISLMHLVSLNGKEPIAKGSAQHEWLEEDLRAAHANRAERPFVVVMMHYPMYTSNIVHGGPKVELRKAIEPLLQRYGVDVVFSGHDHGYERTTKMRDGSFNAYDPCRQASNTELQGANPSVRDDNITPLPMTGPLTASTGVCIYKTNEQPDGWTGTVHMLVSTGGGPLNPWSETRPPWTVHRESSFGIVTVELDPSSRTMTTRFIRRLTNEIGDAFVLRASMPGEEADADRVEKYAATPTKFHKEAYYVRVKDLLNGAEKPSMSTRVLIYLIVALVVLHMVGGVIVFIHSTATWKNFRSGKDNSKAPRKMSAERDSSVVLPSGAGGRRYRVRQAV